jgi:hypothetical protein
MPIVDTILTKAQQLRNNLLTQSVSLQSVAGLTSGGILSKFTGTSGIMAQRTNLLQSRITAMNSQTSPVEKIKSFLNPESPSFMPKITATGGILSSLGISTPTFAKPTSFLPVTTPVVTPVTSKQIIMLPPVSSTAPAPTTTTLFA